MAGKNVVTRLPIIAVADLRDRSEHFRCDRLHADLSAGSCADRQGLAYRPRTTGRGERTERSQYASCQQCPVGLEVAKKVGKVRLVYQRPTLMAPGHRRDLPVVRT